MGEILINQIFAGSYLQEGSNIGHEIINLFCDDQGRNYLFIPPSGIVKGHDVDSVVFVQNISDRKTMEVVMKAEDLSPVTVEESRNIYYAGVSIYDIFRKNLYHGESEISGTNIMATFRAEKVRFPKSGHRMILTVDPDYINEDVSAWVKALDVNKKKIVGQSMRTYLSENNFSVAYFNMKSILADENFWEDKNTTQRLVADSSSGYAPISFLEIIRKENDELIFSNLLSYYFNFDRKMFVKFAKEVLDVPDMSWVFKTVRESMQNIDLWIEDEKHVLVIENKIKSGLNGKTGKGKTQLDKYFEYTQKYIKEHNIREAHYFIFVPDYNVIPLCDSDMKKHYKIVTYSEIYKFFKKYAAQYINDKYFADFLSGLQKHTMTLSELRFSIMRSRFLEKANQR